MSRSFLRSTVLLIGLASLLGVSASAQTERIRCRSRDYSYASCQARDRIRNVRVADRHSDRACTLNRSFGWRGDTLWVNHGCDADFEVELFSGGGGRPPYPGPGPGPWPPGGGGGGWNQRPPSWAIGSWRSSDRVDGQTQYLSIDRNGIASWRSRGTVRGNWTGDGVRFTDGTYVRIERDRQKSRIRAEHPRWGSIQFR